MQTIRRSDCGYNEIGTRYSVDETLYSSIPVIEFDENGYGLINVQTQSNAERIMLKVCAVWKTKKVSFFLNKT